MQTKFYNYFNSFSKPISLVNKGLNDIENELNPLKGSWDLEPDIFIFNFMGITGRFFMGNDGEWKVRSEHNLQVICDVTTDLDYPFIKSQWRDGVEKEYPKTLKGFKVRDDRGNTYTFGHQADAIEYSMDFYRQYVRVGQAFPDTWCANAWYLTKVQDAHNNTLYELSYERGKFIASFYHYYSAMHVKGYLNNEEQNVSQGLGGRLISPVYLKEIKNKRDGMRLTFSSVDSAEKIYPELQLRGAHGLLGGSTQFDPMGIANFFDYLDPRDETKPKVQKYLDVIDKTNPIKGLRWRKLNYVYLYSDITIEDKKEYIHEFQGGNEKLEKVFAFDYENKANRRLKLTRLVLYDNHPAVAYGNYYTFGYDEFDRLPTSYISRETDHWGYYNGKDENHNFEASKYYELKEPDYNLCRYGALTSISYPTGGTTFFEYEPHDYSGIVSDDGQSINKVSGKASGLRIRKIINCDEKGTQIRTFTYTNEDGKSSGILTGKPKYSWDKWKPYGATEAVIEPVFSHVSFITLSNSFGSHVGYSRVVEETEGNGYTVYNYSNYEEVKDTPPVKSFQTTSTISPYDKLSDMGHRRGKLLSVRNFSSGNKLLKEHLYTYRQDKPEDKNYVLASDFAVVGGISSAMDAYSKGNFYKIYYSVYDQVKETIHEYPVNNEPVFITTTEYVRKDSVLTLNGKKVDIRMLKELQNTSSDNIKYTTRYYYPYNLKFSYMSELTANFRIGMPVVIQKRRDALPVGYEQTIFSKKGNLLLPSYWMLSATGSNAAETEIAYDEYDTSNGNLLRYTTRDGISHGIVWGYRRSKPVAFVDNISSYSQVSNVIRNDTAYFSNATQSISRINSITNKLRTSLTGSVVKSCAYIPFGIATETAADGTTIYYTYDRFGRLFSTADNEKKITSSFFYNYRKKPFLAAYFIKDLNATNSGIQQGDPRIYKVMTSGSPEDYDILWELANGTSADRIVYHREENVTQFETHAYSNFQLVLCTVKDKVTGESCSFNTAFSAKQRSCKLSNVKYQTEKQASGIIEVPVPDTIRLKVFHRSSTQKTTLYINGEFYEVGPYVSKIFEIPSDTFNARLSFSVSTTLQTGQGTVDIELLPLKNQTSPIDENNKYIVLK